MNMGTYEKKGKVAPGGVQAVLRAMRIMESFSISQPDLSLAEISHATGYHKSTILRQSETLVEEGYLQRDKNTGRFRLGYKLFILGQVCGRTSNLLSNAEEILQQLVDSTQESAALFVAQGAVRRCLIKVHSPHFIRAVYESGDELPIHAGASGKVLLANMPPQKVSSLIEKEDLAVFTPQTVSESSQLYEQLRVIRDQGYAVSMAELTSSGAAVAAPVYNGTGQLVCSISISGPVNRFVKDKLPEFINQVVNAAEMLSVRLGYSNTRGTAASD
jgi:DNA-binding IclR family transcriptional regulator